jgi:hypothetical protein
VTERHPPENALVLHYYGELRDSERRAVDDHVANCDACAAARRTLGEALDQVDAAGIPEPDAGFEDRVWARVQVALPARRTAWVRPFIVASTLAAVLVGAVVTGYLWIASRPLSDGGGSSATAASAESNDTGTRERVLLTALDDHFSQLEILLVELMNARAVEGTSWEFQRTTADDLVASNRLYRQTARLDGELQLANMLEDLEGVLVEIASSPDTVDRQDVDFLRTRVENDALLFKVRAVATDIRGRQERLLHRQ